MQNQKILVFLPTYNEAENVGSIVHQLKSLRSPTLSFDILFCDDGSPDGTGRMLDEMAAADPTIRVVHRVGKQGIGSAHQLGIRMAYEQGYKTLITMDCDFSHSPEYIKTFIETAEKEKSDIVVGSRYMMQESLSEWNVLRKSLTSTAHFLTVNLLKMKYDATGAFRLYKLDQIPVRCFDLVRSVGYSFFFESLFILSFNDFKISEVAIRLPARTYGHSKMSIKEAFRSVFRLFKVYRTTLLSPEKFRMPVLPDHVDPSLKDDQGWDEYWDKKETASHFLYDLVAAVYRRLIIRPLLNHFMRKNFKPGSVVLHAGCGGGQVDVDLRKRVSITALDISVPALVKYGKINRLESKLLHGSIFKIPSNPETYDGIYNLGVMEHFSEAEIQKILLEFRRVLKADGKLLLFWPPEFGSSVVFLKMVHFVFNKVFKKSIKLHPDEISRVRSRQHAKMLLEKSGFVMKEYYFGPRDLFTYAVIAATPAPLSVPVKDSASNKKSKSDLGLEYSLLSSV